MTDEGLREYYAEFREADAAISATESYGGQVEDGERSDVGLLIGLGLLAVAKAIQAQTLGLRHAAAQHDR